MKLAQVSILVLSFQALVGAVALANPTLLMGRLEAGPAGSYVLKSQQEMFRLDLSAAAQKNTKSLLGRASFVKIESGENFGNALQSSVQTNQVPTLISGDRILRGPLMKHIENGSMVYTINGTRILFGRSKLVNGTEFDGKSRAYFVGRNVRAIGTEIDGKIIVNSLVRDDVFSADPRPLIDPGLPQNLMADIERNPIDTIAQMVRRKIKSPEAGWFRKTILEGRSGQVRSGDPVLLITASGGQEDSMGSVNGHFAAGLAHVKEDLSLDGELFNVYVTNEKEIVPGNIELVDYFGHLVSGQLNYRPTYTLAIYGLSEESIVKVKNELDRFHPLFREGNTKITVNKNCATLTVQALGEIGIYGTQRNGQNGKGAYKLLSSENGFPPELNIAQQVKFIAETKRSEFMPGPAFTAILQNLKYLDQAEHLGLQRVDFIYGSQTPSARRVGRAPTRGVLNQFRVQGQVGAKSALDLLSNRRAKDK